MRRGSTLPGARTTGAGKVSVTVQMPVRPLGDGRGKRRD